MNKNIEMPTAVMKYFKQHKYTSCN